MDGFHKHPVYDSYAVHTDKQVMNSKPKINVSVKEKPNKSIIINKYRYLNYQKY